MQNKNIVPVIAVVLAFVLICAALTCAFIAIGNEFDLYDKFFGGTEPEQTEESVWAAEVESTANEGVHLTV